MQGMIKGFWATTLLAVAAVHSGCGNSPSATGSLFGPNTSVQKLVPVSEPDAPPGISNESPMARPASVAWTSARAKRCGFFFDPVKLRTTYLAYEARQPGQEGRGAGAERGDQAGEEEREHGDREAEAGAARQR